jgi:hypothetical protein
MKSFWIDNQARTDDVKDESSVPFYDREFTLSSSSLDGSATFERFNTYVLSSLKYLFFCVKYPKPSSTITKSILIIK